MRRLFEAGKKVFKKINDSTFSIPTHGTVSPMALQKVGYIGEWILST